MARKLVSSLLALSLLLPYLSSPPKARACGPFFPLTIFVQTKHPDLPLKNFAAGELGVLQPTYARSYLVVAYRYLTGGSFTPGQQNQLLALWMNRLDRYEDPEKSDGEDAEGTWLRVRKQITGLKGPEYLDRYSKAFPTYRDNSSARFYYWNCLDDAFSTAQTTLRARAMQFGAHSEAVRDWVKAQDAVFHNCGGEDSSDDFFTPQPAADALPTLIKKDREYQIAAAQFYAHRWTEAERSFSQISQETDSPWRKLASIVAIRCKIRMTTDATKAEEWNAIALRLRTLDLDPSMRDIRPAVQRTLRYVLARSSPEKRVTDLSRFLQNNAYPENLYHDLDDYTILLDRVIGDYPAGDTDYVQPGKIPRLFEKTKRLREQNDLTDWIFTYQASGTSAAAHAMSQWRSKRTAPWLICALSKARPDSPDVDNLLADAASLNPHSPGILTVTYSRAQLFVQSRLVDEARQLADSTLSRLAAANHISASNLFLSLRMSLATDLQDFATHASRRPALITLDDETRDIPYKYLDCNEYYRAADTLCKYRKEQEPPLFDEITAIMLTERFPTRALAGLSAIDLLPVQLRSRVAKAGFTRAVLLKDESNGSVLAERLIGLDPSLKNGLQDYLSAKSGDAKLFAGFHLILKQPEMHPYVEAGIGRQEPPGKIDSYKDNWWCSWIPKNKEYGYNYYRLWSGLDPDSQHLALQMAVPDPAFLDDSSRAEAAKELQALQKLGPAAETMGEVVLAWAKAHPNDPRVPEALHNLNRADRYGCDERTQKNYSKLAFQLLHKKYPDSEWTKKTPYWF